MRKKVIEKMRDERGFTMVEMAVVIAVLMILTTIAMSTFTFSSGKKALNGATRVLASDLQLTRMMAVAQNKTVKITYISNKSYVIELTNGTDLVSARDFTTDFPGVTISDFTDVNFNSRGTSNSKTITLTGSGGETREIDVLSTGRISVN